MPVEFSCQKCRRRLSVTQRKRGAVVNCPKCGQPNVVPQERPDSPSDAMAALAKAATAQPAIPEILVFDDVPELIAQQESAAIPSVSASLSAAASSQTPSAKPFEFAAAGGETAGAPAKPEQAGPPLAPPTPWMNPVERSAPSVSRVAEGSALYKPRPLDALLVLSRRAVYALAGLLFGLSLLAFTAGFLIGRGRRPAPLEAADADASSHSEPVALEGGVIYSAAPGQYKPDAGAVAIALPIDQVPEKKLPAAGLRPGGDDESVSTPTAIALAATGGAVAWANREGDFQLVVPQPGEYLLLVISRHAKRPAAKAIAKQDLDPLKPYFADAAGLIGPDKYSLSRRRIVGGAAPLNQDFGLDGK